jgi:CheY-like chemotaxis protein
MENALRGCRILVVEDNFLLAETLRELLSDCGCETVGPAPRVAAALKLCNGGGTLDGAFLDINLGSETCFAVADLLAQRGVPFMFLSGYGDLAAVPPRHRGVPRLAKPFDLAEIVRVAGQHFKNHDEPT